MTLALAWLGKPRDLVWCELGVGLNEAKTKFRYKTWVRMP